MHLKTFFLSLFALAVPALSVNASVATMNLEYIFSGLPTQPQGTLPWLSVKLEDGGGLAANTVRLTFDATNLYGTEFASHWYMNLKPALNAGDLSLSLVANPTGLTLSNIEKGVNAFKADGDGYYDLHFDFPPPPGNFASKFTTGEKFVVDVSLTNGLSVSDFFYQSVNSTSNGTYYSAAHIQGIDGSDNTSVWVGATAVIPEPSTYALLLSGAVLAGVAVRRRAQRQL